MDTQRISCVVADDHPALLAAVSDFLEENSYDVVAAHANCRDAVEAVRTAQPDVAVLDYRMPGRSGVELIKDVLEASADTRIVVYTGDGTTELAAEVRSRDRADSGKSGGGTGSGANAGPMEIPDGSQGLRVGDGGGRVQAGGHVRPRQL